MNSVARLALALCIVSIAFGTFAGAAAAQDPSETTPRLIIELDTNGDANVVYTDVYNLSDSEHREVFEAIRDDPDVRDHAATQRRDGLQVISEEANADLDREIRVGDVTIELSEEGETGIVAYRFRWENLAVVEGDRIVLSEPFSTYDSLDRELIVFAPEGEELISISPQPQRQGTDVASWPGFTQFGEGFEVVSTGADAPADEIGPIEFDDPTSETYGSAPIALGVSVLLLATLLVGRPR
jgi:hypothetical protein